MAEIKITQTVAKVLREFLEDPAAGQYGFELMKKCEIPSGSLYPVLIRLEGAGWLVGQAEDIDPVAEGRPPRKVYTLTPLGQASARVELQNFTTRLEKLSAHLRLPLPAEPFGPGVAGGFA